MTGAIQFAIGASIGDNFSQAAMKAAEAKKGKNYYLTSAHQASQIVNVSTVASSLSNVIPNAVARFTTKAAIEGMALTSLVACPIFASAKQKHYPTVIKSVKTVIECLSPSIAECVPNTLNKNTEAICIYLAENLEFYTKIGMLIGTGAIGFVNPPLASGLAIPFAYHAMDAQGWVPRPLSKQLEKYLPALSNVGLFLGGGFVTQGLAVIQMGTVCTPFNHFICQKIDERLKARFNLEGPTIAEIKGPVVVNKHLSFDMINAILDSNSLDKFTLNYAHCSKPVPGLAKLPKDFAFSKFLALAKTITWTERYVTLKNAFFLDDRFFDYMESLFPDAEDLQDCLEVYVAKHAQTLNKSSAEFLADKFNQQLEALVQLLKGERRGEGSQKNIEESIQYCAQILAYLSRLNLEEPRNKIILEDALLKLGVEGGEYCPRGVKRASKEIVRGILHQQTSGNPIEDYEQQLLQALETERVNSTHATYKWFIGLLTSAAKGDMENVRREFSEVIDQQANAIATDVHMQDVYDAAISYGLRPFSEEEESEFGFKAYDLWTNPAYPFRGCRVRMYSDYYNNINKVIGEIGNFYLSEYICAVIRQNTSLSAEQQEAIIEKYTECNEGKWSSESTQERFNRLACVQLDIVRFDSISEGWTEIDFSELSDRPRYLGQYMDIPVPPQSRPKGPH